MKSRIAIVVFAACNAFAIYVLSQFAHPTLVRVNSWLLAVLLVLLLLQWVVQSSKSRARPVEQPYSRQQVLNKQAAILEEARDEMDAMVELATSDPIVPTVQIVTSGDDTTYRAEIERILSDMK